MEEDKTQQAAGCTGDCKRCSIMQRGYCASQIAYNNMLLIGTIRSDLKALSEKVEAKQNESDLVAPMGEERDKSLV